MKTVVTKKISEVMKDIQWIAYIQYHFFLTFKQSTV